MEKIDNRVVTVSVYPQGSQEEAERSLLELERLGDTAGGEVFAVLTQMKNSLDVATCVGEGKLEELSELCKNNNIKKIVFDCELTPAQIKNIENATDADVIDRSMLILDIFALHATSAEGKIQVELAQVKYTAPRLMGKGKDMSRLGGGIGTRGPGESKLEIDRRRLSSRIAFLQNELKELEKPLLEVLALARQLIACEVLNEPLKEKPLCGLTQDQLRSHSHRPQEFYNQPHFMPEVSDGKAVLRLNRVRCAAREAELKAVAAIPERMDILRALNRMSSMLYILMIQEKAKMR